MICCGGLIASASVLAQEPAASERTQPPALAVDAAERVPLLTPSAVVRAALPAQDVDGIELITGGNSTDGAPKIGRLPVVD